MSSCTPLEDRHQAVLQALAGRWFATPPARPARRRPPLSWTIPYPHAAVPGSMPRTFTAEVRRAPGRLLSRRSAELAARSLRARRASVRQPPQFFFVQAWMCCDGRLELLLVERLRARPAASGGLAALGVCPGREADALQSVAYCGERLGQCLDVGLDLGRDLAREGLELLRVVLRGRRATRGLRRPAPIFAAPQTRSLIAGRRRSVGRRPSSSLASSSSRRWSSSSAAVVVVVVVVGRRVRAATLLLPPPQPASRGREPTAKTDSQRMRTSCRASPSASGGGPSPRS